MEKKNYGNIFSRLPDNVKQIITSTGLDPAFDGPDLGKHHYDQILKKIGRVELDIGTQLNLQRLFNIPIQSEDPLKLNERIKLGFEQNQGQRGRPDDMMRRDMGNPTPNSRPNVENYIQRPQPPASNYFETQFNESIKRDIFQSVQVEKENLNAIEFVNLKSMNLLAGRMISPSLDAFLKERNVLIEYDHNSLKLTPMKTHDLKKFKCKTNSEFRDKKSHFEKFGFGVSAEISSWPVFNAAGQYDQTKVEKQYTENAIKGKFDSCVEVQTIKVLSVKLEESYVRISTLALKQLRHIYHVLKTISIEEAHQESFKFFEKFGSAVNLGRHVFGGYKELNMQAKGNESMNTSIKQHESNKDGKVGGKGLIWGIGGKGDARHENNKGQIDETNKINSDVNVQQHDQYNGGVFRGNDNNWLHSLETNNKDLVLIESDQQFVSVYKLLLNSYVDEDIEDIYSFAKFMAESYKLFTGFLVSDFPKREVYLIKMTQEISERIARKFLPNGTILEDQIKFYCGEAKKLFEMIKFEDKDLKLVEIIKKRLKIEEFMNSEKESIASSVKKLDQEINCGYHGNLLDGKKHGKGIYYFSNGEKYDGNWKDDRRNGKGIYDWIDGRRYEGDWKDSLFNGKGVYDSTIGDRYDGDWKDGKKDGQGIFYSSLGERYEGSWKDSLFHGTGVYYSSNGERYEGDWKESKKDGKGILYSSNGERYDGDWKDDKKDGKGIFYSSLGERYEGDWKDGKKDGYGIFSSISGEKYEGAWKNNLFDGKGIYCWKDGEGYVGDWKESKKDGKGTYCFANGDQYEGFWKDGKKDGKGIHFHVNGDRYEGDWKDGKKHGKGIYYWKLGTKYEGNYKDDKKDGKGIKYSADGTKVEQNWKNGVQI